MDPVALRGPVIRELARAPLMIEMDDHEVGGHHSAVAIEIDQRQAGKMNEPIANGLLVCRPESESGNIFDSSRAVECRSSIEHSILEDKPKRCSQRSPCRRWADGTRSAHRLPVCPRRSSSGLRALPRLNRSSKISLSFRNAHLVCGRDTPGLAFQRSRSGARRVRGECSMTPEFDRVLQIGILRSCRCAEAAWIIPLRLTLMPKRHHKGAL